LDAGRRHLDVTVLCQPPGEGDFDFAGPALKKLGLHNCAVGLATGFPGFLAVVDGRHLLWGAPGAELRPLDLPLAAPALAEILQLKLIIEKICRRGGALKTCRRCGRPLVLINQSQLRGLSDEQPLQVSCLGCNQNLGRQRLDEMRHPFKSPPKCGVDHHTPYQKLSLGRHQEAWVCPLHQGGPACPSFRVIPGDCP
jgi:RNase P subunit RPR2